MKKHPISETGIPNINLRDLYRALALMNEDYTFEPTKDTQLPAMSSRHTMTQLPGQEDRDDLMKPYHFTKDKSSTKSNLIRKKYRNKNRHFAVPTTRLPLGY